jgi:rare lipoprotein A
MRINPGRILSWLTSLILLALAGCSTTTPVSEPVLRAPRPAASSAPVVRAPSASKPAPGLPELPPANSGRGAYYQDDGPGDAPPAGLENVPDAQVRNDPLLPFSNRPYVVFGKTYTPITDNRPYTQIGVGSWYGKKFHGQRTSSGELYDMYKMTAAHPTLPIPSYARLTNLVSGAVVIVRINDRGPFHASRAIDVSYTAALKLGLLGKGSHELQIERILPDEVDRMLATRSGVSGTVAPRLAAQTSAKTGTANGLLGRNEGGPPLLLTAATSLGDATPASTSASDIEALMRDDRAPGEAEAPGTLPVKANFYLQLGAYARAENAEAVRGKLRGTGLSGLEVVKNGAVHRLYTGPFASRQEALEAARSLPLALNLKPIVIQR